MIKETYETVTHMKTEKILTSSKRYCDVCSKEITGGHWEIVTGGMNWEIDDNFPGAELDACCVECLEAIFYRYISQCADAKESDSEYIDIYFEPDVNLGGEL